MLDLIKASTVPANLIHAAAHGALSVPAIEALEILVYLTTNPLFGPQAQLTLAGWDEPASRRAVADPATPPEILHYFIAPNNLRPALLPDLLENSAVREEFLIPLAAEGSRDVVCAMLASPRVRLSHAILHPLSLNVQLTLQEAEQVRTWIRGRELHLMGETESCIPTLSAAADVTPAPSSPQLPEELEDSSEEATLVLQAFQTEHADELAAAQGTPFTPLGGTYGLDPTELAEPEVPQAPDLSPSAPAAAPARIKPTPAPPVRESVLQKIARLDVKGRVQLAVRGTKEERAILVRDGTKLVALAVLQSPKISDGEVEKFAAQKNVLEATLRGITMHRRFMKNYAVIRNLTFNPRTPIDLALGLVKNLMIQDLKNLSGNKEVPDTIRKMALRAFKQKLESTQKN
jgi:hypothetical protein